MLTASGLDLRLGGRPVLAGLDLEIEAGEVLAVVGPSGAGKTTLLLALCGLVDLDEGRVIVGNRNVTDASRVERDRLRRDHFGFVFQFGDLVPELTVVENVSLPLRLQGVRASTATVRALAQLASLGVDHLGSRPITEISGGEMQRVAICRAVVHDPQIVLADEPTGALDEDNAVAVFDLLAEHARARSAAVVLVTHENWLARRADRVLRLVDGRLVA